MKTIKNYFLMMAVALCAVACSDSDDEENVAVEEDTTTYIGDSVAGTYTGYTWTSFFSGLYTTLAQDETLVITTGSSEDTVDITYTNDTWGEYSATDVTVTETSDGYSLSGTGVVSMENHSGSSSSYDYTVEGTISADLSEVTIQFYIASVMNGTYITFYLGSAPAYLAVAGSYDSYSSATVFSVTTIVSNGEAITITADPDEGEATLTYSGTWGSGSTTSLTVEDDGSQYVLSGEGTVEASMSGTSLGTYSFTVEGTISYDYDIADFTFSIELGAMGTVAVVTSLGYAPAEDYVVGSYTGYILGSCSYFTNTTLVEEATVTISDNGDGTFTIDADSYGSLTDATIEVDDDGVYNISGTGAMELAMNGTSMGTYDCELTGTISSDKEDVEVQLYFAAVMGGFYVNFYQGTLSSDDEDTDDSDDSETEE